MRFGPIAENPLERIALRTGLVPVPLGDTMVALLLARTLMTATKLGVFEALADGPLTADGVAARCGTDARATNKLLFALAGARYLRASHDRYSLAPIARKWLLERGTRSLRDAVLHRYLDAALLEHAEEFVRTGDPVDFHRAMTAEQWDLYQRGQRAHAVYCASEVARRTPVPHAPRAMLDLGGAHGYFSVALCRRHPSLRSTILELPEAVALSSPRLAEEGWGDRISYHSGDVLTEELGAGRYDLVFAANLVHHFTDRSNRDLVRRIARALRPGGCCAILEIVRPPTPGKAGQIGALLNFYFAVISTGGTRSLPELAEWQREAGLVARKPVMLRTAPGYALQAGKKR